MYSVSNIINLSSNYSFPATNEIDGRSYGIWLQCENHRNGIKPRPNNPLANYTEFPSEYRPGAKPYEMSLFEVINEMCEIHFSERVDPILKDAYFLSDRVRFPVHPVNFDNPKVPHINEVILNPSSKVTVSPTSSTRTLFVLDPELPPHCLKPHTDLRITRWRRHMEARKIRHAITVNKILEQSTFFATHPNQGYFPESMGAIYGGGESTDWGFIIREMVPQPTAKHPCYLIPLCSFYVNESPLIMEMIRRSEKSAEDYIINDLLIPIIEGWIDLYLETGILLEPHGQNVVVEIDPESCEVLRLIHRDLDCVVNLDLAEKFDTTHLNPKDVFSTEGDSWAPKGSHLSIIFDHSMSVPFNALDEIAQEQHNIPKGHLQQKVKEFLSENYSDFLKEHFPPNEKVYNFVKVDDGVCVKEEDVAPKWR